MFKMLNNCIICGILIPLILTGRCAGFKTYDFHDICTDTINDEAGELRFDAQKLSSYSFGNKCSVTVQPRSDSLPQPILVSFYFTKFDLSETCEYLNVTVQEESILGKPVQGLTKYLCGHNETLEKPSQIFTTSADVFIVTFQRQNIARHSRGNFNIKFIAISSGECVGSDVFNCSNGRCIADKYKCSDDVNVCGDDDVREQACDILDVITELVENIGDFIQKYSWVIPVLIGLCVLNYLWKKYKDKFRSSGRCDSCRNCLDMNILNRFHTGRRSSNSSARRNSLQLQTVDNSTGLQPSYTSENERESGGTLDESYDSSSSESGLILNEDPASDVQISLQEPTTPAAPPPSYDEVMTSSYASAPSYEEVIENKDKYKTDM